MSRRRRRVDMNKPVLLEEDAAELLGLDRMALARLVRSGQLPAYRFPGAERMYFLTEEVAALARRPS